MKSEYWRLPEGVEDLLPPQAWELELIRRKVLDLFRAWDFEYVKPPLIEFVDALRVAGGRDLDLQTLKAVDQRSGRLLGVRADLTSQAARIDASRLGAQGVLKLCYAGPVVYANPQGALDSRVPIKAGAEIFGATALEADAEIIALMVEVLQVAGVGKHLCPIANCTKVFKRHQWGWDGHVGSVAIHPGWHPEIKDAEQRKALFKAENPSWDPQRKAKGSPPKPVVVLGNMGVYKALTRPLRLGEDDEQALFSAVQCKSENDIRVLAGTDALADLLVALPKLMGRIEHLDDACLELRTAPAQVGEELARLRCLAALVKDRCLDVDLRFDLAELAGYSYHNGPVFAAFHGHHGQVLARGGRYDGIGAVFGRSRPATGFDVNLKRILGVCPGKEFAVWAPWCEDDSRADLRRAIGRLRDEGYRVREALGPQDRRPRHCSAALVRTRKGWRVRKPPLEAPP